MLTGANIIVKFKDSQSKMVGKNKVNQLEVSAENITVLVQTKLQKSSALFRTFFHKSAKNSVPDFPSPTRLFSTS
jgi:hypothetical protein